MQPQLSGVKRGPKLVLDALALDCVGAHVAIEDGVAAPADFLRVVHRGINIPDQVVGRSVRRVGSHDADRQVERLRPSLDDERLVPRQPCAVGWKTLVSYGPLARSVADARLTFQALAGWHPRDRHSLDADELDAPAGDPRVLRIVASEDLGFAPLDDDVRVAFRIVIALLEGAGAQGHARAGLVRDDLVHDRHRRGPALRGRGI